MKQLYTFLFAISFIHQQAFSQADCSSAITICGNTRSYNPSGIGTKLEQLGCGSIEHNSIWLAFQAKASGKLNFVIRSITPAGLPTSADFDWSLFLLPGAPGTGNCSGKTKLSCNTSGIATVFGIPGATGMATPNYTSAAFNPGVDVVSGNWYAIIVDQVSNSTPILFSIQFTGNPESSNLNSSPGIFDNQPDFSITTTSGCSGVYSFTSSSTATAGIASYLWDFGDSSTSTNINPTHTYATTGTYYVTLTVTDNNGCQSTIRKQVVFNDSPPVVNTAGILSTPSCTDANNGAITITTIGATTPGVTGGTPPYSFELISPSPVIRSSQTSNVFTGLQQGTYTIKVTDACGKSATNTTTVSQISTNSTIGLTLQNTQAACNGMPSGTATIFANGTVPPYTMSLVSSSPVLTSPQTAVQRDPTTANYYVTFTNLLPGVYTVEATDACSKVRRATFTVTASTFPTVGVANSASCAGTATGIITVTSTAANGLTTTGAPGTFQYALIAPSPIVRPFQYSSVFENLLPGTYTIAVKDTCGNIGTAVTTIATASAPIFGTVYTSSSCPNANTGTIEAQISGAGGGSPYTFELISPSPVTRPAQSGNQFTSLPAGTYTVRLTDVCGSQVTGTATVAAAAAPSFTTSLTTSCSATASGTITIIPAASNIGPFTFELISPGAAIRPAQPSNVANTNNSIFTGLNQGSYTIRMTDGCSVPVTGTVTISAPSALTFPAGTTTIPSCGSSSTGRIVTAQPSTGLGAYKYELISPSPITRSPQYSRIFDNVPAGTYTIRITDSCGTQIDNSGSPVTVAVATAPALSVSNTASCASGSGTITATASTSNQGGGYQFALISPSPVTRPNQTSQIFTGLSAGSYTVQITDQCGLTGTATTTLAAAGTFTPVAGGSVAACNGTGYYAEIVVTNPQNFTTGGPIPTGSGGGPYTYALYDATNTTLLAGPQSSNLFTTVTPVAGSPSHTVRVTDACGNTGTATVTLNPPSALSNATLSAITASCASAATGVLKVTSAASGGLSPYTYTLLDANTLAVVAGPQTNSVFNNVPANATGYLIKSTDACGNSNTSSTPLLFPAAVTPTATTSTTASCATPGTGKIVVTPGTGSTLAGGTFTYSLYDAGNTSLISGPQSTPVFTGLLPATYTVRITDICGTTGTASATVASGAAALTASGTAGNTCTGGSTGSITGSFTGGSLPVTYSLIDQSTSNVIAGPQTDNVFTGIAAGTYIVQVTDACGTIANSSNVVLANASTSPTITTSTAIDCSGSAIIGAFGGSGSGGPYTYSLCSGSGCSTFSSFTTSSTFTVNTSGVYRIAVQDRCGNQVSSSDITVTIPVKAVITGISKTNPCGATTITPTFTNVPNTPYYSVDGANFSATLGTIAPGCHSLRVTDYNAGTYGCASDAYSFSVLNAPMLTAGTPVNWSVTCGSPNVTPALVSGSGSAGCPAAGGNLGAQLTACSGCTVAADPVGTMKTSGVSFYMPGAQTASFQPVVILSNTAVCNSSPVAADFTSAPFSCSALPIHLLSFSGERDGVVNQLHWQTATEQNNKGFAVLRSIDGINFTETGFVNSAAISGNSTQILSYAFTDYNITGTRQYYRLRQENLDGQSELSTIVLITGSRPDVLSIDGVFPNPAHSQVTVVVASPVKDKVTLQVTDITGKIIIQKVVGVEPGNNTVPLQIGGLSNGLYFVKVVNNSGVMKFVKE